MEEKKGLEPAEFRKKDTLFALLFLCCGFFYVDWVWLYQPGAGITGFTLLFAAAAGGYLWASGFRQKREALVYLALIGAAAVNFSVSDALFLKQLLFLYLSVAAVYWVAVTAGRRIIPGISAGSVGDLLNQLFRVPFHNFFCGFQSVKALRRGERKDDRLINVSLGLVLCVPVLIVVVWLLSSADLAFARMMDWVGELFTERFWEYFVKVLLGIPVACYLFGLVYGNIRGRGTDGITAEGLGECRDVMRMAPGATVYAALTALNLVYVLFFLSQAGYLFSAFRDVLPETLTYAEYARRGFFQLCLIAGINLGVLGLAHLLVNKKSEEAGGDRVLKWETVILSGFTLLLIATALSKMAMYIHYYGLTQLRVYTSWFMILVFLLFCVVIVRQFVRFNGTKGMFAVFTIAFLLLCYGNVDGLIARYNIERYEAGTLISFRAEDYWEISAGAVPYLAGHYEKLPSEGSAELTEELAREKAEFYLILTRDYNWDNPDPLNKSPYWEDGNLQGWNLQAAEAQKIADQLLKEPPLQSLELRERLVNEEQEEAEYREQSEEQLYEGIE